MGQSRFGLTMRSQSLEDYDFESELHKESAVVVIVPTYDNGTPNATTKDFYQYLKVVFDSESLLFEALSPFALPSRRTASTTFAFRSSCLSERVLPFLVWETLFTATTFALWAGASTSGCKGWEAIECWLEDPAMPSTLSSSLKRGWAACGRRCSRRWARRTSWPPCAPSSRARKRLLLSKVIEV